MSSNLKKKRRSGNETSGQEEGRKRRKAIKEDGDASSSLESESESSADGTTQRKNNKKRKTSEESSHSSSESDENENDGENVFGVYVEGIPYEESEENLWNLFKEHGELIAMRLPRWHDTGRLRGYGIFDFASQKDRNKCIEKLNGHTIGKRYLKVEIAEQRKDSKLATPPKYTAKDVPETCNTIFVKNLPYEVDEDTLREAFSKFGMILDVRLARWNNTGRMKGFGYVQFKSVHQVRAVLGQKSPIMVGDRAAQVDADVGAPKASFRGASGQPWKKTVRKNLGDTKRGRGRGRGPHRGRGRGRTKN